MKWSVFLPAAVIFALFFSLEKAAWAAATDGVDAQLKLIEKHVAIGEYQPKDILQLQEIIKRYPRNPRAHYLVGIMLEHGGYDALAEQEFALSDKLDPSRSLDVLEKFTRLMNSEDFPGAAKYLRYVKTRFPNDPSLLLMQGLVLESKGYPKEAEALFTSAMGQAKPPIGLATALGDLRIKQRRYKQALELAQKDLARNPEHFGANVVTGTALVGLGRDREGIVYLKKAYGMRRYAKDLASILSAALYGQGLYAEALEPALVYMAMTTTRDNLANSKVSVGKLVKLLSAAQVDKSLLQAAERLKGTEWEGRLFLSLGDVYDQNGLYYKAVQQYVLGVKLDPTYARGWYRLGEDLERLHQYKAALQMYKKAQALDPNSREILLVSDRLDRRYTNRSRDLAWQLKDWLWQMSGKLAAPPVH